MKAEILIPEPRVQLEMTMEQAFWLKAITQNPLDSQYGEESKEDRENREQIWRVLCVLDLQK